tara:strand:- start:1764 stop:1910 length:147 start_codon:yes stop_codon:yes gene_type:complete
MLPKVALHFFGLLSQTEFSDICLAGFAINMIKLINHMRAKDTKSKNVQ